MSHARCPGCQVEMDPTRARVARVVGARVVTFCSAACAEQAARSAAAGPAGVVATGPAGVVAAGPAGARPGAPAPVPVAGARAASAAAPPAELASGSGPAEGRAAPGSDRTGDAPGAATDAPPRRRSRRVAIAIAALVGTAGLALAVTDLLDGTPATGAGVAAPAPVPASGQAVHTSALATRPAGPLVVERPFHAPASPVSPTQLVTQARAALVELLESPSRRIQRIAAIALTRERNPAAVKHLQGLLERESSDLGRIEIAQALARAGEARGFEVLREALGNAQRDVRLDAARALVELGDPSGAKQLTAMLSISGYRVGAAGLLARLGDQKAMEVLREELRLADATEESRMRAAVALGRAGDASVRQTLLTILDDGRYNVGAADALAALGERQAEAALVRQLNLASLRVGAAEALRRLGSKLDLGPLAVALESGDDVGRVSAAEAILILASSEGGAGSH